MARGRCGGGGPDHYYATHAIGIFFQKPAWNVRRMWGNFILMSWWELWFGIHGLWASLGIEVSSLS